MNPLYDAVYGQGFLQRQKVQLAEELNSQPTAIAQAELYLQETVCSISEYIDMVHKWRCSDLVSTPSDVDNSILITFMISLDLIRSEHQRSAEILFIMAV